MSDHNNRLRQKDLPILINDVHSVREEGAVFGHNSQAFFSFLSSKQFYLTNKQLKMGVKRIFFPLSLAFIRKY